MSLSTHTTDTARRLAVLGLFCMALALPAQTIVPVEQEPVHTVEVEWIK